MPNEYKYLYGHILEVIKIYDLITKGIRGKLDTQEEVKLVKNGLRDSILMTLCRIFDTYPNSGHLYSFLKDTHCDDELMNLLSYNTSDQSIKKLRHWRVMALAHIDESKLKQSKEEKEKTDLTPEDIKVLMGYVNRAAPLLAKWLKSQADKR